MFGVAILNEFPQHRFGVAILNEYPQHMFGVAILNEYPQPGLQKTDFLLVQTDL